MWSTLKFAAIAARFLTVARIAIIGRKNNSLVISVYFER